MEVLDRATISVVMATYNGASYIEQQISSILSQSYKNIELIICDDCSSDGTREILYRYQGCSNVKIIFNEENLGYVKNFEKLLKYVSGDFIALADQDDIWHPEKLRALVDGIDGYSCIHSNASMVDSSGGVISSDYSQFSRKMITPSSTIDLILNGCVTGCTCLFKKELLESLLPFPPGVYVHDMWIGLAAYLSDGLVYTNERLIDYRQHEKNSHGTSERNKSLLRYLKFLISNREKLFGYDVECDLLLNKKCKYIDGIIDSNLIRDKHEVRRLEVFSNILKNLGERRNKVRSCVGYFLFFPYIEKNKPLIYRIMHILNVAKNQFYSTANVCKK